MNEKMIFVQPATLVKRYKRFLADVIINGKEHTIHVPNTGAMTNCGEAGDTIWYSTSDNLKRKYAHTWELTEREGLICVNPQRANHLINDALQKRKINGLEYDHVRSEVTFGDSRIDFLLSNDDDQQLCFVEVKSATLLENNQGYFPDTITKRGQKHIEELINIAEQGHRAVLLFAILHSNIKDVKVAEHIDPKYADLLKKAQTKGVEVMQFKPNLYGYFKLEKQPETFLKTMKPALYRKKTY